jgi:uncharacterized delta-60 repeat protein
LCSPPPHFSCKTLLYKILQESTALFLLLPALLTLALLARPHTVHAQAGSLDATFAPTGTGLNSQVYATTVQADGKVLVGGLFTFYNGTARNRIARLNADGTLDASFVVGTGLDNSVLAIAVQADGKVLVGGFFTNYNGTVRNRIARLNADGTLDVSFAPTGTGLSSNVFAIAVQPDRKVLVGGAFTDYNGTARGRIARLEGVLPFLTSFSPSAVSPGITIIITGSGFTGTTAVSIGGIPVASFTVNSNIQITAVVGSGTFVTGGQQQLVVTTPSGVLSLGGISVGAAAASGGSTPSGSTAPQSAVISGISPSSVGFGTLITVTGSGFTGATGLRIGGIPITNFVVVNDGTITGIVGGVPVSDRVQLTGGLGASLDMSGLGLTYLRLPAPAITSVAPASLVATGNDVPMTLSGVNFVAGARAQVSDGTSGQSLTVQSVSANSAGASSVVLTLPGAVQSLGTKTITLTNPDGQTASVNFTVTQGASVRLVSESLSFSTTASGRAFSVRLAGANIFRTAQALLNGAPARVTVTSSTDATVEIPASLNVFGGVTLALRLTNTDGQSTSATVAILRRSPPTILAVTLQSGGVMRVRGVNFLAGITSSLGNVALTLLSQDGETEFTAQIPSNFRLAANSPTVSLTVQNTDGRSHGVLLPRSLFEAVSGTSSNGASAERTWENSSAQELVEIVAGKQTESASQEMNIYPNPMEGELRIGGVGVRTVRVVDMRGGVALEERTVNGCGECFCTQRRRVRGRRGSGRRAGRSAARSEAIRFAVCLPRRAAS